MHLIMHENLASILLYRIDIKIGYFFNLTNNVKYMYIIIVLFMISLFIIYYFVPSIEFL